MSFGERLKQKRKERKLSLEALGEKTGMAKGSLSNYENGKREPGGDAVAKLARALGTTADFLLGSEATAPLGGPRTEGGALFLEDVAASHPHRAPDAAEWLKAASKREYTGTEGWGRMVWFRRYLEDWNAHRKGGESTGAVPATKSAGSFADRQKAARERKEPRSD